MRGILKGEAIRPTPSKWSVNIQDKHLEGIPPDQRRLIFDARAHTGVLSGKRVVAMEAGNMSLVSGLPRLGLASRGRKWVEEVKE